MLTGLTTLTLTADDVAAARDWYADLLGTEPYFARPLDGPPAYVEFRVGPDEDELGIIDRRYAPPRQGGPGPVVVYWHVEDVAAAMERMITLGANEHEPLVVREGGFVTGAVLDPFGNPIGLMTSPHWAAQHGL